MAVYEVQPEGRCPNCGGVGSIEVGDIRLNGQYVSEREPCEVCGGTGSYLGEDVPERAGR